MRPEPSVHDNFIYAYGVDCEARRLTLHTAYRDREPHEFTDIVFRAVVAHHFEHALPANILCDVEETDVADLVHANEHLLAKSWRHGWPPVEYRGDLGALVKGLKEASVRAVASFGLSGWVLAGSCERVTRGEPIKIA